MPYFDYICSIVLKFIQLTFCFIFVSTAVAGDSTLNKARLIQSNLRNAVIISPGFARHVAMGTMSDRFGNSNTIGLAAGYKFGRNYTFTAGADIIFSGRVKENTMFDSITGPSGSMIDAQGNLAVVRLYERGYHFHFDFGKIIVLNRIHRNSGLLLSGGIGMMQHKIKFQFTRTIMPQLENDIYKGYDRLSNGMMLRGFAGYHRMEPGEMFSYYIGLEYLKGFTRSRRELNYDTRTRDTSLRNDILFGLKFGLIIPIHGRQAGTKKGEEEQYFQ